jgi:membrane fusion protein (multidrug efflux system)
MKQRQLIIILVLGAIVVFIGWKLYDNYQINSRKKPDKTLTEKYARVERAENKTLALEIKGFGRVNPARSIQVAPEVAGIVVKGSIPIKQGLNFRKGQLLFKIDDREASLSLKARKSSFLNLMAGALADVKIDYPESYDKWLAFFNNLDVEKTFPELPKMESSQEKTFLASRNILGEYYTIKKDEIRLSKYSVYAPFNGYYAQVMQQEGAFAGMGTPIATLSQDSDLEVIIPIENNNARIVQEGMRVHLLHKSDGKQWDGTIKRIEQQINANTQSINVYAVPLKKSEELLAGMYLETTIFAGMKDNCMKIPRKAMVNEQEILVVRDSVLRVQHVVVILEGEDHSLVAGVKDGELVVVEQMTGFQEGQRTIPLLDL